MDFKPQNAKKAASVTEAASKCADPILEPKFDGWRAVMFITEDGVQVWSRTGKRYDGRHPEIEAELAKLPVGTILDGEVVADDQDCTKVVEVFGRSVSATSQAQRDVLRYVVFDVLHLGGADVDTCDHPLRARRNLYTTMLERCDVSEDWVVATPWFDAVEDHYTILVENGYEGAMVKDGEAKYAKGKRGHGFWKIKAMTEIDVFVMGMELDGKGQHDGKVGRFVVGQYEKNESGELRVVERAKVNPYDDAMRDYLTEQRRTQDAGGTNQALWRVMTIKHYGFTDPGLRHPVFVTWREDKDALECGYDNG